MNTLQDMLFDGWQGIGRVLVVRTAAYALLVLLLRVPGKRTLSMAERVRPGRHGGARLHAGHRAAISRRALAEGLAAFAVLAGLQAAITAGSVRWPLLGRLVKAEPTLLLFRGQLLDVAMRRERVTRDEVMAAVRAAGHESIPTLRAVVLETDGSLSVDPSTSATDAQAIDAVLTDQR